MLQGTGSDVGKSVLTAAVVRIARRRGFAVAPFKPQNMSNNAAACPNGEGEIGRAQALQAQAAGLSPRVDFNPVLLKPQTDRASQVVVHGRAVSTREASDYIRERGALLEPVMQSFRRLSDEFELLVVEGAGSPAEVNLRRGDIANMGFARAADVPVCLIADIERGGVIASLVGTQAVLDADDAAMIEGFIVNKFRGDPRLFDAGVDAITAHTGWRSFGVVPWLPTTARLPAEDAVGIAPAARSKNDSLRIAAPMLSRMANFDDADPLRQQPGVDFAWIPPGQPLPRDCDVVMLFGTKSTLGDLAFLREQGWDHDIHAHARNGGRVLGICGGYQLLGRLIHDPDGIDGPGGSADALGLLDVETTMHPEKTVRAVDGVCIDSRTPVTGYEIHVGETAGADCERPMFEIAGHRDGAVSANGRIAGTYLHGMFANDAFRHAWLRSAGSKSLEDYDYAASVEAALDALADHVEQAVDVDALLATARRPRLADVGT
ncbi:MAG: cobyric acid synthase [Pseudomonadota bacterium]